MRTAPTILLGLTGMPDPVAVSEMALGLATRSNPTPIDQLGFVQDYSPPQGLPALRGSEHWRGGIGQVGVIYAQGLPSEISNALLQYDSVAESNPW